MKRITIISLLFIVIFISCATSKKVYKDDCVYRCNDTAWIRKSEYEDSMSMIHAVNL